MIRLWVKGALCDVPNDFQPEVTYKVTDAEGLETQCSSYSMSLDVPRTETNMGIFTPLFDIRTIFGSASFDINANADAILEVNNRAERGYVKMERVDGQYHLRFYTNAGKLLEKLRSMKLADLTLGTIPFDSTGVRSSITKNYDAVYGLGTDDEHFTYFPAFSEDDPNYDTYRVGVGGGGTQYGNFPHLYTDMGGNTQTENYSLTHHQARNYNISSLRAAVQVQWIFKQILQQAGFTFVNTTDFFDSTNTYWKNLFMVLKQRTGDSDNPITFNAAEFMPDMSCEDFILGYCKLFGLWIVVDGLDVRFLTRFEYYDISSQPDISEGIDRKIGIAVKPNQYSANPISCGLELEGTDEATYGRSFKDATNLYEGVAFKYGEMMKYRGPRVSLWKSNAGNVYLYDTNIIEGTLTLPYISSTDGGELYFRFNNYNVGNAIRIHNDTLNNVYDGISGYASSGYISLPEITTLNAATPLYAERAEIMYNFKYKVAVPAQQLYTSYFAAYVNEIQSKNNVIIECEGHFMPDVAAALISCRKVVMLDNVRCRVIECVTDGSGHCKLTLQKIDDVTKLIAGQGFGGYYLRSANFPNNPLLMIPSSAQQGDVFTIPVETNDTISYLELPNWLTNNGDGTVTLNTNGSTLVIPSDGTLSGAEVPRIVSHREFRTAHAGSIYVAYMIYNPENCIIYWPGLYDVSILTGTKQAVPEVFGAHPDAKCIMVDAQTDAPFTGDADLAAGVDNSGVVTLERLTSGAYDQLIDVITYRDINGSRFFLARSVTIEARTLI